MRILCTQIGAEVRLTRVNRVPAEAGRRCVAARRLIYKYIYICIYINTYTYISIYIYIKKYPRDASPSILENSQGALPPEPPVFQYLKGYPFYEDILIIEVSL